MSVNSANLAFSSNFRYEYTALKGSVAVSIGTTYPATIPTYTIAHNLGYTPYFKCFFSFGDGVYFSLAANEFLVSGSNNIQVWINYYTDATNLYVGFANNTSPLVAQSGTLYYRIYAEPTT